MYKPVQREPESRSTTKSESVPLKRFPPATSQTAVALPSSGKLTEHVPATWEPLGPGTLPATGQSAFSIAFQENGTAGGHVEVSLTYPLLSDQSAPFKCTGKVSFTAKLA
ncbi:MAG TPA: hypothetical protein VMD79_14390 [Solirubrobacteraceae bacterium]|nr:hypothetical protein [Solirubrobacteraceae bacterium]